MSGLPHSRHTTHSDSRSSRRYPHEHDLVDSFSALGLQPSNTIPWANSPPHQYQHQHSGDFTGQMNQPWGMAGPSAGFYPPPPPPVMGYIPQAPTSYPFIPPMPKEQRYEESRRHGKKRQDTFVDEPSPYAPHPGGLSHSSRGALDSSIRQKPRSTYDTGIDGPVIPFGTFDDYDDVVPFNPVGQQDSHHSHSHSHSSSRHSNTPVFLLPPSPLSLPPPLLPLPLPSSSSSAVASSSSSHHRSSSSRHSSSRRADEKKFPGLKVDYERERLREMKQGYRRKRRDGHRDRDRDSYSEGNWGDDETSDGGEGRRKRESRR